ncbi:phage capsid protein [Verrucomicrobium sp. BvORR106]|uniref:phage capsid protein n=1 Tax=Verrucomicrobium sp. BvORR106 TaxID=1403819 RepID=UPI000571B546|nr:phage capsid protein [Verrucomicrobium sp. BvORR106]
MPTALDIPEFAVRSFETRWGHVVQQQVSKLRDKVTIDEFQGKEKVYRDLSTLVWRERLNRLGDSLPQEIQGYKRKLTKRDFACQHISDRKDAEYIVAQLTTPGSEIEQAMRMSWNRKVDEMIAQGVSATVYGGAEPYVTPITLTGSRQVAVNYVKPGDTPANSGLTPWKLIELARKFETQDVFLQGEGASQVYLAIGPKQKQDLYAYVAASPNDVWAQMMKPFLADESQKLFGFHIVMSNRLTLDGATDVRTCVAWAREGMVVVPENMQIMVDRLPEKDHAIQVSAYADYGVMRRYEEKVGEVYCDESP